MNFENKELDEKEEPTLNENMKFNFIDLFSGIGGFRLAFESLGGKCIFSSDIDKWANKTYFLNFNEYPQGDITKISSENIPDHDILCAGFPCQSFSIGGYRKGFCDTRGTLFFEIERILKDKLPKAFILENVRGLVNHDKGKTFNIIKKSLQNLGYSIFYEIINSKDFGIPQNRERIYIVGFLGQINEFKFPIPKKEKVNAYEFLEKDPKGFQITETANKHLEKHYANFKVKKKINKDYPIFATEIRPSRCSFRNDGISPCLTAKMGTGGNNVPVLVDEKRKLTVRECLRLQGFPDTYKIKENYSQSYKQVGNSVTVPIIRSIGEEMINTIYKDLD